MRVKGQLTKFESRAEASCTKYRDNYESDDPNFDLLQVAALAKFKADTLLRMQVFNNQSIHCKPIPCNDYRDFPV